MALWNISQEFSGLARASVGAVRGWCSGGEQTQCILSTKCSRVVFRVSMSGCGDGCQMLDDDVKCRKILLTLLAHTVLLVIFRKGCIVLRNDPYGLH